jgi:hypothetical protein
MQESIAQETLTDYLRFSQRDARPDSIRGRLDGEKEIPASEQKEFSSHELRVIAEGQVALTNYTRRLRDVRDGLHAEVREKKASRDDRYKSEKESVTSRMKKELQILTDSWGEESPRGLRLRETSEEKRKAYHRIEKDLGRPPLLRLNTPWFWGFTPYIAVFTLLAILEAPINYIAIEVFFQTAPIFSAMTALFVGVLFVSFAHMFGVLIRQTPLYSTRPRRFFGWTSAIGVLALAISVMTILFLMRAQAGITEAARLQENANTAFVQSVLPAERTIVERTQQDLLRETREAREREKIDYPKWGMLILNIAVFFVGTALSIVRHDPHPDYETLLQDRERADKALEDFKASYIDRRGELHLHYEKRLNDVETWSDVAEREIKKLEEKIENLAAQAGDDFDVVLNVVRLRILAYQDGNHEGRKSPDPLYFGAESLAKLKSHLEVTS